MDELMLMVEKFCSLEEMYAELEALGIPTLTAVQAAPTPLPAAPKLVTLTPPKKQMNNIKVGSRRVPKEHDFVAETTVFTVSVLLRTIMRLSFFCWPKEKLDTNSKAPKQDTKNRCSYHDELGHCVMAC